MTFGSRLGQALPYLVKKPKLLERSRATPVTFDFRLGYTLLRNPKISNVFYEVGDGFLKLLFLVIRLGLCFVIQKIHRFFKRYGGVSETPVRSVPYLFDQIS